VRHYDGLKEELYLADFVPDEEILERLGVTRREVLVVARSGATRAAYHGYEDRLFMEALARLGRREDVTVVVLARHPEHRAEIHALGTPNLVLPRGPVDGRSLMRSADAFVGAGGTMTREAALLGTPTLTVFGGAEPAVDRWLEQRGVLRRLHVVTDVDAIGPRETPPTRLEELRARSRALVELFVAETVESP
jgi:predicted glycosyltransferase